MDATLIRFDREFLNDILRLPEAALWSKQDPSPNFRVYVMNGSNEFDTIYDNFALQWRKALGGVKIERVENPYLLGQYLLKKHKTRSWTIDKTLYHCTQHLKLDQICKLNFNWRLRGTAKGHKFGQGVSFTPDPHYASHYGNVMIVARVSVGRKIVGHQNTVVPPEPYDTTANIKDSVYVKYEDDDFYPEYIIHY